LAVKYVAGLSVRKYW